MTCSKVSKSVHLRFLIEFGNYPVYVKNYTLLKYFFSKYLNVLLKVEGKTLTIVCTYRVKQFTNLKQFLSLKDLPFFSIKTVFLSCVVQNLELLR